MQNVTDAPQLTPNPNMVAPLGEDAPQQSDPRKVIVTILAELLANLRA